MEIKETFLNPKKHVEDKGNEWSHFSGGLTGPEISKYYYGVSMKKIILTKRIGTISSIWMDTVFFFTHPVPLFVFFVTLKLHLLEDIGFLNQISISNIIFSPPSASMFAQ